MLWKGKSRKNKLNLIVLATFIVVLFFVFSFNFVFAQGLTSSSDNLASFGSAAGLSNTSLPVFIGNIVRALLGLLGVIAVLIILYAGFVWMTANGDPGKIDKAKKIMVGGVIGLVIIVSSFAIASFIMNALNMGSASCDAELDPNCGIRCEVEGGMEPCGSCGGSHVCTNGVWSQCSNLCTTSNGGYIISIKGLGCADRDIYRLNGLRGTFSIPATSTLEIGAYAYNNTGQINAIELMRKDFGQSSFISSLMTLTATGTSQTRGYGSLDTSSSTIGSTTTLKILISQSGGNNPSTRESYSIDAIIRENHCFNCIQDEGEVGIDCGGGCGSCYNDPCKDANTNTCDPNNDVCAFGQCSGCFCKAPPHIDSISPFTVVSATPSTTTLPNGAPGNFISILGRGFGTTTGSVNFINNSTNDSFAAPFPGTPCNLVWTDNQIIAMIPSVATDISNINDAEVISNPTANYSVVVNNGSMDSDNQVAFQVNHVDRPGICSAVPDYGVAPSTTQIIGNKFLKDSYSSDVVWDLSAFVGATWEDGHRIGGSWQTILSTSTAESNWTDTSAVDTIPMSGESNMAKVRVYDGQNYSNYFRFTLSSGLEGSFCGSYEGMCVTDNGICNTNLGLVCNHNSCTCQKSNTSNICIPGIVSSTAICAPVGNCSYVRKCNANGNDWDVCAPSSDDPNCASNLFIAQATQSLYAWGFKVTSWGGSNQSCGYDVWGICDPRGCQNGLTCNTEGGVDQWLELYNSSSTNISMKDWKLAILSSPSGNLVAHYPLYYNTHDLTGRYDGRPGPNMPHSSFASQFSGYITNAQGDYSSYVEIPTSTLSTNNGSQSQEGTISVWVKPSNIGVNLINNPSHIIYFGKNGGDGGNGFGGTSEFHLSLVSNGSVFFGMYPANVSIQTSNKLNNNTWYHLVSTYKANDSINLYLYDQTGNLIEEQHATLGNVTIPNMDLAYIARSINRFGDAESRYYHGFLSNVSFYNKSLSKSETAKISKAGIFPLLGNQVMSAGGFYVLSSSTLTSTTFSLPQDNGLVSILNSTGGVVDSVSYTPSGEVGTVSRTLSPSSFGRSRDGLNDRPGENFISFNIPTKGGYNSANPITNGSGILFNEILIPVKPCTCQAAATCSREGEERACSDVDNCPRKQFCRNGHWTDCQIISEACYTPAVQATQAVFSWVFTMHASNGNDWPFVIEDCSRNLSCDPNDRLPSPTPWYFPSSTPSADEGWSVFSRPDLEGKVINPKACNNAIISARFSQKMLASSFSTSSVRVYKQSSSNWTAVGIVNLNLQDSDRQLIIDVGSLEASSTYKVVLTEDIKSYNMWPLKKTNASYLPSITSRDCSINGITNVAYCWNFQTRSSTDPDFKCKEGCPNCTPNPTKGGYYGDQNINNANLDSKDNVCLMLDPWDSDWDWSVSQPAGLREFVTNFSYRPVQTSVALGETTHDTVTTTINATLVESGKSGICRVENDFTNPYVMTEPVCNASSTPSPSPYPGSRDVCLNAAILARFNMDMYDPSVIVTSSTVANHPNIIIQACDNESQATSSSEGACDDIGEDWTSLIFPYNHTEMDFMETVDAFLGGNDSMSNLPEGILVIPEENLSANTWYRVIVKGSNDGVHSATNTSPTVEQPQGVLVRTNFPDITTPPDYYWVFKTGNSLCKIEYVNVSPARYTMPYVGLNQRYMAIPYSCDKDNAGIGIGTVLNPAGFTWNWRSLIKMSDDINEDDMTGGKGINIANICTDSDIYCTSYANPTSYLVRVWGIKNSPLINIKARAQNTRTEGSSWDALYPNGDKFGFGQLRIGAGDKFSVVSHSPDSTTCSNPDIKLYFSEEVDANSILLNSAGNVRLYKCSDSDPNCNNLSTIQDLAPYYPANFPNNSDPRYSSQIIATTTSPLQSGNYRVMVRGGFGGITSWAGNTLSSLNYKPSENISGEACEQNLYPWNTVPNICDGNCKLNSSANLCGTRFEECTTSTAGSSYCNSSCHDLGNNNIASCGNSKIELGEDCDDGNIINEDGCNSSCLFEGSNKNKYGSLCGNAKIEKGEQCDDGNTVATGDGCNERCLYEATYASSTLTSLYKNLDCSSLVATTSVRISGKDVVVSKVCQKDSPGCNSSCLHNGSMANVPVCGNGIIEKGEQCDDNNSISGDGCLGTENGHGCLWEGAASVPSGTCGNEFIENGQNNYYSWTFNVSKNPIVCQPAKIDINPCPNGVWRVSLDSSISSSTILIHKGYADANSNPDPQKCSITTDFRSLSFFGKIVKRIKIVLRDFVGVKLAIAENYWCEISNVAYSQDTLHAIDKGNYEATTTIDGLANSSHIVAYPDPNNGRVINYISGVDWVIGTPYKLTVLYSKDNISSIVETSTKAINIFSSVADYDYAAPSSTCSIRRTDTNAWPMGEMKNSDTFLCKGDNCGLSTPSDLYDDDVSADWNQTYQIGGNKPGNQHLYRSWAYASQNYLVRARFKDFSLISIPYNVGTQRTEFSSSSYYNGGSLITSGNYEGRTILSIGANNSTTDAISVRASTTMNIRTVFCKNPWPSAQNPLFYDTKTNCSFGVCFNSNFETWYCRDAGIENVCVGGSKDGINCKSNTDCPNGSCRLYTADDLPAIGSYDSVNNKWNASVSGIESSNCPNLPNDFIPRVGYYDKNSSRTYIWNSRGVVYQSSSTGWIMISRSDLAKNGLPGNFTPMVGYYNEANSSIQLWDYDGNLYEYSGGKWMNQRDISKRLQEFSKGFKPTGGYYYNSVGNDNDYIRLWNSSGKIMDYSISTEDWGELNYWTNTIKTIPTVAYNLSSVGSAQMWDNKGNLFTYNGTTWSTTTRPASLPTDFWPDTAYNNNGAITAWDAQKSYISLDDGASYSIKNQFEKTCERKVKEFLFISNDQTPVQSSPASEAAYQASGGVSFNIDTGGLVQLSNWNAGGSYAGSEVSFDVNAPYAGQYNVTLETSNSSSINYPLPAATPSFCKNENGNVYHKIEVYIDSTSSPAVDIINPVATGPNEHQITRTASFNLSRGLHKIILHWVNNCNIINAFDSNLTIYGLDFYSYNSDAIGIRVMTNNNHYSPYHWYMNTFNGGQNVKGLSVDGYNAISEGRTVYVNATDLNDSKSNIFSDIFLMSYSQGSTEATTQIYNQMVNNWRFNVGIATNGGLDDGIGLCSGSIQYECRVDIDCGEKYVTQSNLKQNLGTCIQTSKQPFSCSSGFRPPCLTDSDCQKMGVGYCNSSKAGLTRDSQRLSDIQDINYLLNNYYSLKRCSNDQTRLCIDSQSCFGGGICSNYYPDLKAGTYIAGRTFSAWPSWQDNLAKLLGYGLPVDPINKFFGCVSPFESSTCWNVEAKAMSDNIEASTSVYFYKTTGNGTGYELFVRGEYDQTGDKWHSSANPWSTVNLMRYNPFAGYLPASFARPSTSCGDGVCGDGKEGRPDNGEDCSVCWTDCGCNAFNLSCRPVVSGFSAYSCQNTNICGDGIKAGGENCDCGDGISSLGKCGLNNDKKNGEMGSGCDQYCQCQNGYDCGSENPGSKCGDGKVVLGEQCDFINGDLGRPTCGSLGCCGLPGTPEKCQKIVTIKCDNGAGSCQPAVSCPTGYVEFSPCKFDQSLGYCTKTCKLNQDNLQTISCANDTDASVCEQKDCSSVLGTGWYLQDPCHEVPGFGCQQICQKTSCGNAVYEPGETCDCGSVYGATVFFNPFTCLINNSNNPIIYSMDKPDVIPYSYCSASCQSGTTNKLYCGDSVFTSPNESCDKNINGGYCCTSVCQMQSDCNGCANGCCWKSGDGRCDTQCGETHTPNTCDDCAPCHNGPAPLSDDNCCGNNCNWFTGGFDPFNSNFYCDASHNTVDCAGARWDCQRSDWRDNGTVSPSGCTKQQIRDLAGVRAGDGTGATNPVCDPSRSGNDCTGQETQWVSNDSNNNGKCCRGSENGVVINENFSNESACPVIVGDQIVLKAIEGGNQGWVSNKLSDGVYVLRNPAPTQKLILEVRAINGNGEVVLADAYNPLNYLNNKANWLSIVQEVELGARSDKFRGYYFGNSYEGIVATLYKGNQFKMTFTWDPDLLSYDRYCLDADVSGQGKIDSNDDFDCSTLYQICDRNFNCSF